MFIEIRDHIGVNAITLEKTYALQVFSGKTTELIPYYHTTHDHTHCLFDNGYVGNEYAEDPFFSRRRRCDLTICQ